MIRLAEDQNPDMLIPLILEMVEVEVQTVVVGIDVGHVTIVVVILELTAILYKKPSGTPPVEYSSD